MNATPVRKLNAVLLWCGPLLLGAGFILTPIAQSLPHAHVLELLAIAALASLAAAAAHKFARIALADAFVAVFALALIAFVGPLPALAAALVLLAALGLGATVAARETGIFAATIAGIALLTGALGWLLPFPLHFRFVYFSLFAVIALLTRARTRDSLINACRAWRATVSADPLAAAAGVFVVGLASVGCWIPTVQFDDLGYHLALPTQLATLGYYRLDAHSQIWALAPWAGDLLHAFAQVLAGSEARGAIDAWWLCALAGLSWQLACALGLSLRARWLCTALAASQPLSAALVGGMQAELPATAAALALALCVARYGTGGRVREAIGFALIAGLLLGLKAGFVAIVVPCAAVLMWQQRARISLRGIVAASAIVLLTCGSSYAYAYALTGNPLFPILNAVFRSPLMAPVNLGDPRWSAALGWDLPWRLTFYTRDYAEGWSGLAGFSLLALLGAVPVALTLARVRWLTLVALCAFSTAIGAVHYYRYSYPALTLLLPCLVAAVYASTSLRSATWLLSGVVLLNLLYQGTAYWTLHKNAVTLQVAHFDRDAVLRRFAPERALIAVARTHKPDANMLLCEDAAPYAAELAGRGFVTSHYDPELTALALAANDDPSGARWRELFGHTGASFAIVGADASPALRSALDDAQRVEQIDAAELWRLPARGTSNDLVRERDAAAKVRP